jgi:hypothetical protein
MSVGGGRKVFVVTLGEEAKGRESTSAAGSQELIPSAAICT